MTVRLFELAGADPAHRFSPYCWRIRFALAHKQVVCETVAVRFHDRAALAISGQDKVPVLIDQDAVIADSTRIARHLEATRPGAPSLFGGARAAALGDFILGWTDTVLHPQLARSVVADIWRHLVPADQPYFRESREARFGDRLETVIADRDARLPDIRKSLEPVRRALESHPFLAGETPLYADYAVFGAFQWARMVSGFELLASDDPVYAWRERMLDLYDGLARKAPCYT